MDLLYAVLAVALVAALLWETMRRTTQGNFLARVEHLIPPAVMDLAILHAADACERFAENSIRRGYVLSKLSSAGIPDSMARLAIELAVVALKAGVTSTAVRYTSVAKDKESA